MKISVRIATSACILGMLTGAAMALPGMAAAQVAGGSQAGVGPPRPVDNALFSGASGPVEPPRCIHRAIDLRRGGKSLDDNRLSIWLSVHQTSMVVIKASGTGSGGEAGTIAITLTRDGIPVANSPEVRGPDFISANTSASVKLVPGQQYKITAKAIVTNKRLDLFDLYVGVGKTCP